MPSATNTECLTAEWQVDPIEFGLQPSNHEASQNAKSNGVDDLNIGLRIASKSRSQQSVMHGLYSLSTGILDSHQYMQTLLTLNQQQGMLYAPHTITSFHPSEQGFIVRTEIDNRSKTETYRFNSKWFINSAGLWAQHLPRLLRICPTCLFPQFLCKGEYFDYRRRNPFSHLIYPLPDPELAAWAFSTQI